MSKYEKLTDEQWQWVLPMIPPPPEEDILSAHDDRAVLDGVLWVLRTGSDWVYLPERYPSGLTCYRRFSRWLKAGAITRILETLARHLEERGNLILAECFIDGTFIVARKGKQKWERPSGQKARCSWALQSLLVFHSQCTRVLLAYLKSPLSESLPWMKLTPWDDAEELWGIVPGTMARSIDQWLAQEMEKIRADYPDYQD